MIRHMSIAALLSLLWGCSPCASSCSAQSRVFEQCLDNWNLEWTDLGALDADDYRDRCSDDHQLRLSAANEEQASEQRSGCSALADALRLEDNCDEAWQTLINSGAAP
tara:strand:+ start:951 stop:1274 length:324 start_codon:yes stop_codon:yes gene_type:complete